MENARRCSHRFKTKHSKRPDEHDKTLLDFIETFVSSFPKGAEEIPRTRSVVMPEGVFRKLTEFCVRERIMSRRGWRDIM